MGKLTEQSDENKGSEGGMFYPRGFIVAAFDSPELEQQAEQALRDAGFPAADVTRVAAADMARQAGENLENPSIFAALGSTVSIRQKQYELAREGCEFLLIKAEEDAQETAAIEALSKSPIRYAVKYRMLVIENMLPKIPSATPDPEPARSTGSSR
ncbi:MAG: hypothetical protein V4650_12785 [Pseudomonadota bacterium]